MVTRTVKKSKGGVQDLLLGKGQVNQDRAGGTFAIDKLDVPVALDTIAEMQALEVTDFTRARVYTSVTQFDDYIYDATDVTGISSDTGNGTWHRADRNSLEVATIAELRTIEPTKVGQQANALGHTDPGLGGGGFWYDAADTTSIDDNGYVIVTAGGKRWKRILKGLINALDFIGGGNAVHISNRDIVSQNATEVTTGLKNFFAFCVTNRVKGIIDPGIFAVNDTVGTITNGVDISGSGERDSILRAVAALPNDTEVIHINDCGFAGAVTANGVETDYTKDESGVKLWDFSIEGDLGNTNMQHGIRVSGRTDWLNIGNMSLLYLTGYGLKLGDDDGVNNGYCRESDFYSLNLRHCGNITNEVPALWITSSGTGDGTNQLNFYGLKCVFPTWKGVVVQNGLGVLNTRRIAFFSAMLHGYDSSRPTHDHTLFTILGDVRDVQIFNIKFNAAGSAGWSMELLADGNGARPSGGIVTGNITDGGNGVNADNCGAYTFLFDILSVVTTSFRAGPLINSPVNFDVAGNENALTLDIDSGVTRWISSYSSRSSDLPLRSEQIRLGNDSANSPSIDHNSGNPNGVLNRGPGSMVHNRATVSQFSCDMAYLRGTGGSTTWRGIQTCVGSFTSNRPATPTLYQSYFDSTLGHPIWWNGTNWVDATGAIV